MSRIFPYHPEKQLRMKILPGLFQSSKKQISTCNTGGQVTQEAALRLGVQEGDDICIPNTDTHWQKSPQYCKETILK